MLVVSACGHADGHGLGDDVLGVVLNVAGIECVSHGFGDAFRRLLGVPSLLHSEQIETDAGRVGEVYDTWMGVNPLRLPIPVQHFHSGVVLHPEVDES